MNTDTSLKTPLPTSETPIRHHNFLSIGARGVGKTVFFVGHYGQSTQSISSNDSSLQFDCYEAETKETIDKIEKYVAKTGNYPSATMKITNFDFVVQRNTENDPTPLCEVCWWDTPGESCQLYNPAFLTMMLSVDGSCLFLDAQQLVTSAENSKDVQEQLQPIQTYGDLLHHNGFDYPIALILTKCDLLTDEKDWKTLKHTLKQLRQHWDELGMNYRLFYSEIPIVEQEEKGYILEVRSKENALTWLVEAAQTNEKSQPEVAIAADFPSEDLPEKHSKSQWGIPVFLRRKAAILVSFLIATTLLSLGGIFLVERAVNSEQGTPAILPTQS